MAENKAQFLDRIRRALGRRPGGAAPEPPAIDEAMARLAGPEENLAERFAERAAALGMDVLRTTADALPTVLVEELKKSQITSIVSALEDAGIDQALRGAGIDVMDWRDDRSMAACYDADAGLTGVAAALAETGSLVLESTAELGRGLSLAPPLHVAVVQAGRIMPDMLDLWAEPPADRPAWQGLISGPSKTSDIEGVLIEGVHGPQRVLILLVDDR